MENKHTFQARLAPYFAPSDLMDIKLAYVLAKFGHKAHAENRADIDFEFKMKNLAIFKAVKDFNISLL